MGVDTGAAVGVGAGVGASVGTGVGVTVAVGAGVSVGTTSTFSAAFLRPQAVSIIMAKTMQSRKESLFFILYLHFFSLFIHIFDLGVWNNHFQEKSCAPRAYIMRGF
jgi:hypothetical protein